MAPVAQDDTFEVIQGRLVSGNLFADNGGGLDSDSDGGTLTAQPQSFVTGGGGTVSIEADGDFTYTAAIGFSGVDALEYEISDGQGGTDRATVVVHVAANNAPIVNFDSFAGIEDISVGGNVLDGSGGGTDIDPEGDAMAVEAETKATLHGTVTILANGDFVYTPNANFNGQDSFEYSVSDSYGFTSIGTVTINLEAVNDAPTAGADTVAAVTGTLSTGNLLDNDGDVDGDTLSVQSPGSFTTANGGAVTIAADGTYTYQNDDGLIGADSFTYTVQDGNGGSAIGNVTVQLSAPAGAIAGGAFDDVLRGTSANNTILSQGGKDQVYGGGGSDKIHGGADDDDLYGENGNDNLLGGHGNDKLHGGSGNDSLSGGAGLDRLRGGSGADRFEFHRLDDGADTVDDFRIKDKDKIDLSDLLTAAFDPAQHKASDFVRITEVAGTSYLDVDTDGLAGAAGWVRVATLSNVTGLTNEDALLASGHLILG